MTPIPPDVYDRDYFLSERCEGWDRFQEDHGLSPIKTKQVAMLGPAPGQRVLDAGCGRGEVLLACAEAGAEIAGLDYAEAAVELSRETLREVEGADVRQGDVTQLPWEDASFDRIIFADVIEHLDPDQADAALREFKRVLRPGGLLLVHTAPNKLFLQVTWPVARVALRAVGRGESVRALDEWLAMAEQYHVNEQTVRSLKRAVRGAGFPDARAWLDPNVLRSGEHHLTSGLTGGKLMALVGRIASLRPLRMFLGNDLYALAHKPA